MCAPSQYHTEQLHYPKHFLVVNSLSPFLNLPTINLFSVPIVVPFPDVI